MGRHMLGGIRRCAAPWPFPWSITLTPAAAPHLLPAQGWIFMLLSVTGVRGGIVKYMPKSIAMASSGVCGWGAGQRFGGFWCSAGKCNRPHGAGMPDVHFQHACPHTTPNLLAVGIGMLLAFTGLRNLGLITFDSATLVTLVRALAGLMDIGGLGRMMQTS